LSVGVLEDCIVCHEAHEFRIPHGGHDCTACHTDIYQDAPIRVSAAPSGHPPVRLAALGFLPALDQVPGQARVLTRDTLAFWHAQHRGVECTACHSSRERHGAVTVTSLRDCRSCHHTAPVATPCVGCHDRNAVRRLPSLPVQRVMNIRVGRLDRPRRTLPFSHADHLRYDCQRCHTQGLALSAAALNCAGCHQEHHQPDVSCMACHPTPAAGAHDLDSHLGCGGAGCHDTAPAAVLAVPRTRDFCLSCHQDLTDHRPGRNCVACHALPGRPATVSLASSAPLEAP
jgi:hypothetical protein